MDPNHIVQPESDEIQSKAKQEEEERMSRDRDLLAALLEPKARERLSRIALVRPEHSKQIEETLLRMARLGQLNLQSQITEPQLIRLLNDKATSEKPKIVYHRRKGIDDFDI